MVELVKSDLRVRKSHQHNDMWECVNVMMFSDGQVKRVVLCERPTEEEAMKVIQKEW